MTLRVFAFTVTRRQGHELRNEESEEINRLQYRAEGKIDRWCDGAAFVHEFSLVIKSAGYIGINDNDEPSFHSVEVRTRDRIIGFSRLAFYLRLFDCARRTPLVTEINPRDMDSLSRLRVYDVSTFCEKKMSSAQFFPPTSPVLKNARRKIDQIVEESLVNLLKL